MEIMLGSIIAALASMALAARIHQVALIREIAEERRRVEEMLRLSDDGTPVIRSRTGVDR